MIVHNRRRFGLTLVELLVVVAILALLAGLILAKMGGIFERSQSAVQAANIHDTARFIETYYALHKTYPDGWDSLLSEKDGSSLYAKLSPAVSSMLKTDKLTTDQINSLRSIGINHVVLHDLDWEYPSDSAATDIGTPKHLMGHDGQTEQATLAILDTTKTAADQLLRVDFNLPSFGSSSFLATHTFVVFGFGPRNWAVSEVVQQAPMMESVDPSRFYARPLAIFAVPNSGTGRASFIGVFGPDGRSLRSSLTDYNKKAPRDH